MQQKVFTVPMLGGDEANEELNRYLRGQRVVSVDKEFCVVGGVGYWTFCVTVADGPARPAAAQGERREKVDYRDVLDEHAFAIFARLRTIRKQLAAEDAVPAYAVFTDALFRIVDTHETTPGCGLPIGNLTSQYFANHYLSGLDHHVKEVLRVPGYVRYMDDMLLFGDNWTELMEQVHEVERYAEDKLQLGLKPALVVSTSQGVSFLGYRLQGQRIGLNSRSRNRFAHKMGVYARLLVDGRWSEADYRDHIVPLLAFAQRGYTKRYRQRMIEKVESRRAPTVCCAAVAGTTTPGTAVCRIATTTRHRTATTTTGSGWSCPASSAEAAGGGMVNRLSSGFRIRRNETSGLVSHRGTVMVAGQQSGSKSLSLLKERLLNQMH